MAWDIINIYERKKKHVLRHIPQGFPPVGPSENLTGHFERQIRNLVQNTEAILKFWAEMS